MDEQERRARAAEIAASILGAHASYLYAEGYAAKRMEESSDMRQLTSAIETYIRTGEWA